MTPDLFDSAPHLERLDMPDADVTFARHIDLPVSPDELLQALIDHTPWRSEAIALYGKTVMQPRLTAWYGDEGQAYTYSGLTMQPLPWTPILQAVRERVQALTGAAFNSVLLNYYRDQRDSMGFHSDDEPELGRDPAIASLSLGATRVFVLKHKKKRELARVRLALPSGSLLLMKGATQHFWRHGIDKQVQPCGPRINLTFRLIKG